MANQFKRLQANFKMLKYNTLVVNHPSAAPPLENIRPFLKRPLLLAFPPFVRAFCVAVRSHLSSLLKSFIFGRLELLFVLLSAEDSASLAAFRRLHFIL